MYVPGFCRFEGVEKTEAEREFQFLEVVETNVLVNEVVRLANRVLCVKQALYGITNFNSHQTCRDSIYKIGKVRKRVFDGSRETVKVRLSISSFPNSNQGSKGMNAWRPLSSDANPIRDRYEQKLQKHEKSSGPE